MRARQVQFKILQVIADFEEKFPSAVVADTQIAERLGLDVKDIQMNLDLMEEEGYVKLTKTFGPVYRATITSRGRMMLQEPDYFEPESLAQSSGVTGDTFTLSGDFRGAILNIKSTLTNVTQAIDALPHAEPSAKEELQQLIEQLKAELEQAPPDKAEEAEAVAKSAELLVETASEEKPNKKMIQITGEGLKQAARNIADVLPIVLNIATQIVNTITKYTG